MIYELFEELKTIISEFIKVIYSKLKYAFIVIGLGIMALWIFKLEKINPPISNIESQSLYAWGINIQNWGEWISLITIVYTAGWAIFQYKKSDITKKRDNAGKIVNEFSETIVDDFSVLNLVIQNTVIQEYVPNEELINKNKLKYFTVDEVRYIFRNDKIVDEYKQKILKERNKLDDIYHIILYMRKHDYGANLIEEYKKDPTQMSVSLKTIKRFVKNEYKHIPYHFREYEVKVLNKLEALCLDIFTKAADSRVMYLSLHQSFLRTIRNLYMDIATLNVDTKNKYYIHVISVYNEWVNWYIDSYRKETRRYKKKSNKDYDSTKR